MTDEPTNQPTRHVPADLPGRIQHYIGGKFVDSADGDTFDVLEPVTNDVYLQAAAGKIVDGLEDVVEACDVHQRVQLGLVVELPEQGALNLGVVLPPARRPASPATTP